MRRFTEKPRSVWENVGLGPERQEPESAAVPGAFLTSTRIKSRALPAMSRTHDRFRPGARARGYNSRWTAVRRRFLDGHPVCEGCLVLGVHRPSDVVDHIVPHHGNESLMWNENNLQACCRWHHDAIKPILERLYDQGKITASELMLTSATATKVSRERHRPAIGANGYAIPGT